MTTTTISAPKATTTATSKATPTHAAIITHTTHQRPEMLQHAKRLHLPVKRFDDLSLAAIQATQLLRASGADGADVFDFAEMSDLLLEECGDRVLREVVDYELRLALADLAQSFPLADLQRTALLALNQALAEWRVLGGAYFDEQDVTGDIFGVMTYATQRAINSLWSEQGVPTRRTIDTARHAAHLVERTRDVAGSYAQRFGALLTEALILPLQQITAPRYDGRYNATGSYPRVWTQDSRRRDIAQDVTRALLCELDARRAAFDMSIVTCTAGGVATLLSA